VEPFSERQKKLLRAAVRVSNETGRSLTVHPPLDDPSSVRDVVGLMETEGIDPARAVIAHGDLFFAPRDLGVLVLDATSWRLSVDLAKDLLDRGLCISVDSFGHYQDAEPLGVVATTDWQRLAGLVALLRAGYSRQIVLGTDIFLKILCRRHGGEGYSRLTTFVIPALRRLGIAEEQIRAMTVENPARILAC
jgi:phosphotriesterase-related protein